MAEPKYPDEVEMRVTDIDDPLSDATFGSINRYVEVARTDGGDEPFVPRCLVLEFGEQQAEHVNLQTLTLFQVDLESREFTPVGSSRVDMDKREVRAWVDQPGTYGLIGLPKHLGVLETLRLLDRYGPQLLEERERGEHGLQDRICGLILCADPTMWGGGGPIGPGDLCQKCLGLDVVSWGRLPERYLLENRPPRLLRQLVEDSPPPPAGPPSLLAWGWNWYGQLGDGSTTMRTTPVWVVPTPAPTTPPGSLPNLVPMKKVVGPLIGDWTLALGTDGTVWAWGFNGSGQLGDGTLVGRRETAGLVGLLNNIDEVVDIAAGPNHGVAVFQHGGVFRWGLNPAAVTEWLGLQVPNISDIVAVAAGWDFTLALRDDGRVFAWGANTYGQLGDGTTTTRLLPVQVAGLTAVRSIAAGYATSYAIKSNGAVVRWGWTGTNTVGGGSGVVASLTPVPFPGLSNVEQISAGNTRLARTSSGEVWFWGAYSDGEYGDGTGSGVHLTPVQVPGLPPITDIAAGARHSLALASDGTVWVWGSNVEGQIGIQGVPVYGIQPTPAKVPLPAGRYAVLVGAGEKSSFARLG